MKKTKTDSFAFNLSFIDMLFNILLAVFSLFILSMIMINDPKKMSSETPPKGSLMITMTWDDMSAHDIDLWLLTPDHQKIGYRSKEGTYATLERDDLGVDNDKAMVNGKEVYLRLNKEVITIRIKRPGHYVVDVYFYARKMDPETGIRSLGAVPVKVELDQIQPFRAIFINSVVLEEAGDEKTAMSFDINEDGDVINFETRQEKFIGLLPDTFNRAPMEREF